MPKVRREETETVKKVVPATVQAHRKFYVNGRLEFSFWIREPESERTHDKIIQSFFQDKDWKSMENYCKWKVKEVTSNKDLTEFYITVVVKE